MSGTEEAAIAERIVTLRRILSTTTRPDLRRRIEAEIERLRAELRMVRKRDLPPSGVVVRSTENDPDETEWFPDGEGGP